jgi:hypothetical protein
VLPPKTQSLTFSPKTLKTIRKRTVTKTMLNFTLRFHQQCSVTQRVFGKNGSNKNFENIWANFKGFSKMLFVLYFVSIGA